MNRLPSVFARSRALDIEAFVRRAGGRLKRSSLQGMVAHVRTFLRFVASSGETAAGLDRQIDTPRVHREEKLPKALPWETVKTLKATAIAEAFQKWSRRSGLKIPFQGVHCLRHSYALHLLRSGLPLKTIGDLLGHRTLESTCVYLRLATDDLRGGRA